MHNFKKSQKSVKEALDLVKKGSHEKTRTFIVNHRTQIEDLYNEYDRKAANQQLELLQPFWKDECGDNDEIKKTKANNRDTAYNLFTHRKFYNDLWEELKKLNGGKTLKCPICGLTNCRDIDHYIPREVNMMPEYSVHYSNLIPTCHTCNNNKGALFLSEGGKRLIFNAYFDNIEGKSILHCEIKKSPIDALPMVVITKSPTLNPKNYVDSIIISTLDLYSLGLMKLFQEECEENLKKELTRLYSRKGDDWGKISKDFDDYAKSGAFNFLEEMLFKEMASSEVVRDWFKSLV